ncbi:preprotein translocase subunit YajC [Paludisphaera sp.]|uniref:preprotein translocase subunit YajC n=1 Tax=Paludisphaera sp. TaxID=2017432 RepID=UPI00301CDD22
MMPGLFDAIAPLLAQDAAAPSNFTTLLFLLPIPLLFYFMIYLPQKDQEKKRRAMLAALKKNDRVVTAGGAFGVVVSIDEGADAVVLRIDDEKGVRMKFARSSITRVVGTSD